MTATLHLLSGGAAQGLVQALRADFERAQGCVLHGRYGAVGAMQEALLAGEACDLVILSRLLVDGLVAQGRLRADTVTSLGRVPTGIAVPAGQAHPDVSTPAALRSALLAAEAIHFPDPVKATAGIHFARVLGELGIAEAVASRLRPHPNGNTAMAAMAAGGQPGAVGCTQRTEILFTAGVEWVGALPAPHDLATLYCGAVSGSAREPALARVLLAQLADPALQAQRRAAGFED
ncbi:MAG: substrate-binding domain-containing protein [Rubrivivax sp.]